jgi:carbamoyltransferase
MFRADEKGAHVVISLFVLSCSWVEAIEHEDTDAMIEDAANRLVDGKVIAWHQGRSEIGPRALGARSVLADPRSASIRQHVNQFVKHREWFRPLAPTVLADDVDDWFEGIEGNVSPYMSVTAKVKEEKRHEVPAICHVDGTARLQTLTREGNPRYYALLKAFKKRAGCPIILNTSFNDKGEPIVETAEDAVRTFLRSNGAINRLYMGNFEIRKRVFPLDTAPAVFGTKKQWQRKLEALKVQMYVVQHPHKCCDLASSTCA